jgi:heterodisulfide reductase subunit D
MAVPQSSATDFLAEVMALAGGERTITCYQCGTCSGSCPTVRQMDYTPRQMLRLIQLGMEDRLLRSRAIWYCLACYSCTARCPREIKITETVIGLRKLAAARGIELPGNLLALKGALIDKYNISGDANDTRLIWSENLEEVAAAVRPKRQAETVYFVGCVSSFFPVAYPIPQSLVRIMMNLDEDFTLLGGDEWCCGYPLYSAGMEALLPSFAEHNIATVKATGARRLVITCPSCYYTWTHIYPDLASSPLPFEVLHASQYLARLMEGGRLKLHEVEQVVTYHDPCDLGRKSGIYDAPREVISRIPGVEFREMATSRENATCCGGGGDVQVVDESVTAAVAARRVRQAERTGAGVILSACQQCKRTLASAARKEKIRLRALDITELVWQAMEFRT